MEWKNWKRLSIAMSALAALIIGATILIYWKGSTTVVLLVRHTERNDAGAACAAEPACPIPTVNPAPGNPHISSAGETRRDTLAHVVEDTGIQAIYASCFCRTQETVATAANNLGLTTNKVSQHRANSAGTALETDVADLVQRINNDHVGQKILVAGHTSTVPKIIEELGGGTIDEIAETEFDNLYVVTIYRGWWWFSWFGKRVRVVRLKYGVPT